MKNIKRFLYLALSFVMIVLISACKGDNSKMKKVAVNNKMSGDFVQADVAGLKQGGVDNYETMQKLLDDGKSIYLGDGSYYVSKTIKLKNAQLIGTASTKTSIYGDGDYTLIEADGQFLISDISIYNNAVDGSEKQGDKVLISLGQNGGVTEGSMIRCVNFGSAGTAIYEAADAVPTQGLDIDTIEYTRVSFAGMDFQSEGRKNNHIGNVYMGAIGDRATEVAEVGARFCGSEDNLKIDQFNVEHFSAETSIYFDGVTNLDISTVHIEGMDIGKQGNGYIQCNNTSGNLGNIVVYWSRVSYENCSFVLLGDASEDGSKLFIESTERFSKLNNLMIEKLDQLKKMQEEMIANIFGDDYQDNQLIICQPNGRPIMQEQLNRKFKDIIVEMRENGYKFTSVPEEKLDDVVFHSVRAASATKKMQVSNGNLKAVMRAGGWAEPDMVIRYSKAYDDDQVKIAQKMEEDYHKGGDAKPQQDAEELLRIIQDNPELLTKLLAAIKP